MKRIFLCLLSLGLAGALPPEAAAQGIGIVNIQRVLLESDSGKAVQAALEERFGEQQRAFAEREREIRQLQGELERNKPLMSKAQVEKKEEDIEARIAAFEKDFSSVQQEVMQAQQDEGNKLLEPARKAVDSVAKDKKLSAVFEAGSAGVMYVGDSADITDDVIKALNAR